MRWIHATIASAVALAAACREPDRGPRWRGAGATEPRRGGTLTFSAYSNVRTLDPAIAYDELSFYVLHHVHDRLLNYAPARAGAPGSGLELVPQLATSWTVSPDGRVYTFALRPGVTFSDGTAVDAGDFVYALERALRTAGCPFHKFLAPIEGATAFAEGAASSIAGLRAVDDLTLEVRLSEPDVTFLYVLAMPFAAPLDRAFVEAHDDDLRAAVLGTGPFVVSSWSEGERVVMDRNPRYWDAARPYLDRLVLLENLPRDTAFLKFEQGELDVVDRLSAPDWLWIAGRDDWAPYVQTLPQMSSYGLRMDVTQAPFDDVRVRRALNLAIDKAHLVKIHNGLVTPSHGILPPGMFGRDDELAPYPHDPARARALLAEAGYPDGFELEYVTTKDEGAERLAQLVQADLAAIGVRMTIRVMSFATYLEATASRDGAPFSLGTWIMDFPDPTSFLDVRFHSRMIQDADSQNDSFYANPELDRILDEARRTGDAAAREALYHRAERILFDDAPWIWGYHPIVMEVVQPYVQDYAQHPVWIRELRDVWLDLDDAGRRVAR